MNIIQALGCYFKSACKNGKKDKISSFNHEEEQKGTDKKPLEVANKATAHLYIVNPLKDHGGMMNNHFSTHPPIAEREKALRASCLVNALYPKIFLWSGPPP